MEKALTKQELAEYISHYQGNSRFMRLLNMADKQEAVRREALELCFELAKKEGKLL